MKTSSHMKREYHKATIRQFAAGRYIPKPNNGNMKLLC